MNTVLIFINLSIVNLICLLSQPEHISADLVKVTVNNVSVCYI